MMLAEIPHVVGEDTPIMGNAKIYKGEKKHVHDGMFTVSMR